MYEDESVEHWLSKSKDELAGIAAALHRDRRKVAEGHGYREVMAFRAALALAFLPQTNSKGIEVGAGDRPWPLPGAARCFYGDVRDKADLIEYFKESTVERDPVFDGILDGQTFAGVEANSLDFVISAHVIEHLADPIGSIREAMRVLKPVGVHLLAVPEMRLTHDRNRPPTTLEHLLSDELDSGKGTRRLVYREHCQYVHPIYNEPIPEEKLDIEAEKIDNLNMDIHWHVWTGDSFRAFLEAIAQRHRFQIIAQVPVQNENIFVLQKKDE